MKARWTISTLSAILALLLSHPALAQVAAETSASYSTRLAVPRRPAGVAQASEPALELRLTARYAMARSMVRSLVRVAQHPENRLLRVAVESWSYYRSSDIELDGASAVKNHFFEWKSLPPGVYDVTVTVFGPDGPRVQKSAPFEVVGASPADSLALMRDEPN